MKIKKMRPSRESSTRCDKFESYLDNDGDIVQGWLFDTGREVWFLGQWVPQYRYPDGSVFPEVEIF